MGSSGTDTVKSTSGPPSYLQPDIQYGTAQARSLYNQGGPQVYPGSTVANRSPETQAGWAGTAARATAGSPINAAAGNYLTRTINGDFLHAGDPQLDSVYGSVASHVIPSVDAQFSLGGRYGSGAQADSLAQGLTNAYAPYALQQYQGERQMQQGAAGMAPAAAATDYTDLAALQGVGTARDTYGQNVLSDQVNRFDANQNRAYDNLSRYMSLLYGNPARSQTTSQPSSGFNWGGLLGGAVGAIA